MITLTTRAEKKMQGSETARFIGAQHGADVSFFWVDLAPGGGPDPHWHPYSETWAVIRGEVLVSAEGTDHRAIAGDIVTVWANTVHSFKNCGTDRLEMICIHAGPEIIQTFVQNPFRRDETTKHKKGPH